MPATLEDYQKASERAQQASIQGADLDTGAGILRSQVMTAVRADRASRGVSQLATDVGQTLGQIPTDSAAIRARAGDVVNPLEVDQITAAQRGQNLSTLGTIAAQSEYNQGTLLDILGEKKETMQAMAQSAFAKAQLEQNKANAIMAQLEYQESVRQFNESFGEIQRQFDLEYALKKAKGSGGGGGGGFTPSGAFSSEANLIKWEQSYKQNLSGENRSLFEARMAQYEEEGRSDEYIKSSIDAEFGMQRFTPEEQSTLQRINTGQPVKQQANLGDVFSWLAGRQKGDTSSRRGGGGRGTVRGK